jgi:hypothetical protein
MMIGVDSLVACGGGGSWSGSLVPGGISWRGSIDDNECRAGGVVVEVA